MARWPKHRPTPEMRRQIAVMIGMGLTQQAVSRIVQLDIKTLYKHYRHELDTGADEANLRVAKSLFDMATKGAVPGAAIFWMRARAGWRDGVLAQIDATVRPGGIDAPPRESLDEWLARRRRELNALDGPRQEPVAGESAQPQPPPSLPNGGAAAQAVQSERVAERTAAPPRAFGSNAPNSAADSAAPSTRAMTEQEADWLRIRRRELGLLPDDVHPNPAVKR